MRGIGLPETVVLHFCDQWKGDYSSDFILK